MSDIGSHEADCHDYMWKGQCFNCAQTGHHANMCPKKTVPVRKQEIAEETKEEEARRLNADF
ncbi:hypothetical protein BDR04DRAFT_1164398 [Suillus decipiens]|nr:hypothetical protein BDR04DRAFT_1164398 [Suillus decipiens]